ncbi:N-(5'-phosphoribosyl)anthranilate isomerase [Frankia sp. AiPs1]|uniref:phosphoribosylanthranilate isomerase n=1 Tax=Frankia sp. AiPa1 TaxID=573492 RepID=UPI00202ACC8E|nr:phosphoribosylanthranilate isomerase [Frankia sp. AiPa1]MCL9759806.1 phosphoribosylanthranilate isomerase [Frankia sp. AiPa1]
MTLPTLRIRTSICANQTHRDVSACVEGGADAIGVLVQVKHRAEDAVDLAKAVELLSRVPPYVGRYAVTHATTADEILELARLPIDTIQLHGDVDPGAIPTLRNSAPHIRLLKAVHVTDDSAAPAGEPWSSLVDGLVLDSINLPENRIGGTGRTHDWSISAGIAKESLIPVILAGGLRPENVGDAVRTVRPWGVNVNSGVEQNGAKNRDLVKGFIWSANADIHR